MKFIEEYSRALHLSDSYRIRQRGKLNCNVLNEDLSQFHRKL